MTTESITRLPLAVRAGTPAINVKDNAAWAHDARTRDAIGALPQGLVDALYESLQESFWDVAKEIGLRDEFDYNVFSEGRSGGWLCIDATAWIEWLDCDDPLGASITPDDDEPDNEIAKALVERDKFLKFADEISELMAAYEADFVERVNLLSKALDVIMHLDADDGLVIGTPEVYVVTAVSEDTGPAVFARLEDAESYSATFSSDPGNSDALVCDAELAAVMIAERADSREDVIDAIRSTYEDRIMRGLEGIRDSADAWNLFADDPYANTDGDEYAWALHLWPTDDRKAEDMVVVTVTLAEDEGEPEPFVSFGLTIIGHGGVVIGFFQPFNVTPECWVNGRDDEAVEMRWADFNANVSSTQVLQWISEHGGK